MFETLIRKSTPAFITLFTIALTVGTVFAQDGEGAPGSTGLTLFILVMGILAITVIFFINWSRSVPDETD
jgi:hypothetical protein